MNFTKTLMEYHKSFDYKSYKAFKKALLLSKNIFNLDVEHIFLGLYYSEPELINNLIGQKIIQKVISDLEKSIFENKIIHSENFPDILLNIFFQAKILSEKNNSLISPVNLLIPILFGKNNVSFLLKQSGTNSEKLIEKLSKDFNLDEKLLHILERKEFIPFIGREKEFKYILESLCTFYSSNILITGKQGVGKTRLIYEIENYIKDSEYLPERIKNADTFTVNSGNYNKDLFINSFQKQKAAIIFIDNLNYLQPETLSEISNLILFPGQNLHIIATSEINEFYVLKEKFPEIINQFNILTLNEISWNDTKLILTKAKHYLESFHKINIDEHLINIIIEISGKIVENISSPYKELILLDKACVKAKISDKKILTIEDIFAVEREISSTE